MNQKSINTLEYNKIIETLTDYAASQPAKDMCHHLMPMTDISQINQALIETNDALSRITAYGTVSFSGIRDVIPSCKRLEIGSSLNIHEFLLISSLLDVAQRVKNYARQGEDSLSGMFDTLDPLTALNNEIKRCIISEEEISDDASPALASIRRHIRLTNDKVHTELTSLVNSQSMRTYLQDAVITTRQGRYCLPVKSEYKSQIAGMVHDQSSTGSTFFIEPMSVVKLNNELRELELKEQQEIEIILAKLSSEAAEYSNLLISNMKILTQLDFIFAKAHLSRHYNCSKPIMNTDGYVNIKKGRHPLIDKKKVVPIDIYIGKEFNLLIITGPNTGGKTVSLKTVGLLTLMGQAGLNIPAFDNSSLSVFTEVYADIGDEQSIEQSLSTFSSHMVNTVNILKHADEKSLILFDEIGAGTDPTEGAALAISILSDLKNRGCKTIATTHYSELKVYALSTDGVCNACCEFDVESLRPTYRLLIGIPGKSNAFAISSKLGLPDYIIHDANKRIGTMDIKFEDLLADLENSRVTIEKEREQIASYKEEVIQLKKKLEKKNENLDERKDKILREANEEAAAVLRDAKAFADKTIKAMNKHGMTASELEKQRTELREKMDKVNGKLAVKPKVSVPNKKHKPSEFKLGLRVKVLSMNLNGTVSSLPDAKGNMFVQMGIMRSSVNINDVIIIEEDVIAAKNPKATGGGKIKMSKSATISSEINLLGLTVDEAISKLDKYLDDAYLSRIPSVRVVHGKGTGALRSAVTAHLRGISYVKSYRLGEIGEGDTGVTIVEFK